MRYFVKTPWWLKKVYPSYTWHIKTDEKVVYLTFDDGPHEVATPFVLDCLQEYGAKASFFCVGSNVQRLPGIYKRIIDEGHATGNHTHRHVNGWNTDDKVYLDDIGEAGNYIQSSLFRPPYGRIRKSQAKQVRKAMQNEKARIIMWDVLSGDFDTSVSEERCLANVVENVQKGSIVVFHDSEKAFRLLKFCLPKAMENLVQRGFRFEVLPVD